MSDTQIQCSLGPLTFEFRTASELKAQLLRSFEHAAYAGGPYIIVGQDPVPAWSWLATFARLRSDWREAAGIALQHAVADGGPIAALALAELCTCERGSVVLLPWTEPLAKTHGAVKPTLAGTGWGGGAPNATFAAVMADQRAFWDLVTQADRQVIIEGLRSGKPRLFDLNSVAELEDLLGQTAAAGRFVLTGWGDGPWSWLHEEVVFRPWVADALPSLLGRLVSNSDAETRATLDWLMDGWDLWRFVDLIDGWRKQPPAWWTAAAKAKPTGWKRAIRPATMPGLTTLGDLALRLLTAARAQVATPPVLDLAPRP